VVCSSSRWVGLCGLLTALPVTERNQCRKTPLVIVHHIITTMVTETTLQKAIATIAGTPSPRVASFETFARHPVVPPDHTCLL